VLDLVEVLAVLDFKVVEIFLLKQVEQVLL
jgi:hypothetical protein